MRLFTLSRHDVMGFMTAGFWIALGLAGVVFALLLPEPQGARLPILVGAIATTASGAAIAVFRARLPQSAHVVFLVFAIAAMATMISLGPSMTSQVAMTALFTCVACHAALILRWKGAAAVIALAEATLFGLTLVLRDLPLWATIPAGTSVVLIGVATAGLRMIASQAAIDSLTGVRNRRGFDREIHTQMAVAAASNQPLSLILLDLDRFKSVNDRHGHAFGDRMLSEAAIAWRRELGLTGLLARVGGDEFAVLLPGVSEGEALHIAERMRAAVRGDCSAGITSWRPGDSVSLFIGRADIGLYRSKNSGRGQSTVESAQNSQVVDNVRQAIESRDLEVHFQPIVRISDGNRVIAVEALVRWPERNEIALTPEELVRTAEDNGRIGDLGRVVLELACAGGQVVKTRLGEDISVTVNISGLELVDPSYADRVEETLRRTDWPADRLILEVTERDLEADSVEAIRQLSKLRAEGVRIAIDDFGKGYSSLTRVASLPCDILKVDREVIATSTGVHQLLDAITAVGKAFELEVVVEGVETSEQADRLAAHGIDLAQGFLYSMPKPALDFGSR
ncbi:putative bifunctional diguanylate cyclase/phosphodiesterase [Smaragdicoccus niigatensis]|uniref:putative bifunctional diguanylate cyclase/phosphodiesterase n=1 Tax=Smaragdicoccus niigatensis TaxID=359359 RepID=UPI00037640F3|nr:EAL domain-containing protein [Smaragdicoccus niigatensis]